MSNKQHFVPMDKQELAKEITNIGKTGNKLNLRIQIAALNAVYYSISEGYIQYGQNLLMSLTNGQRKNSLVAFLEKHGKFQWSKEAKDFVFRKRDDVTLETLDEINELWYETIKAPEIRSSLDVEDSFTKWYNRMEKEAKLIANVKHKEFLEALGEFHAQWHSAQVDIQEEEQTEEEVFSDDSLPELTTLMNQAITGENQRQELKVAA